MQAEKYNPEWIINLAVDNEIDENIIHLLRNCRKCFRESDAYICFVAEEDREKCKHLSCIELEHPQQGTVVIDISTKHNGGMVENVVFGIEFIDLIKH